MKTKTHFQFRLDLWGAPGENIVEHWPAGWRPISAARDPSTLARQRAPARLENPTRPIPQKLPKRNEAAIICKLSD
jgi:hypothetical protein